MVLPLIGAGLMLGGTAANMYGTYQRDKAQKRVLKDFASASNAKAQADQEAYNQQAGVLSGLGRERQDTVGSYIDALGMSERENPEDSAQFRAGQKGALTDIGKLTGGMQSNYAYQGAPRAAAEGMQADLTKTKNSQLAEAMLADHQLRAITERQTNAGHSKALADLLRKGRGKNSAERFQLAKALRDLDWQKKTAAMQGQLDDAGRKGQWANILGGLGTQAGGMMMMSGGDAGAAGGASANGAATYGGGGMPGPAPMPTGPSSIYAYTG